MSVIHSKNYVKMYSDIFLVFKKYNVTGDETLPHLKAMQECVKERSEKEKEEMKLGKYDKMKQETLRLLKKDIDDHPNMDRDFKKRLEVVMQDIDDSSDEFERIIETSRRVMIENGELELVDAKEGTYRLTEKGYAKMNEINEMVGDETQKFIGKIKTEGYNEFLIEADSIEDAQKIWDEFEYKLIREDIDVEEASKKVLKEEKKKR